MKQNWAEKCNFYFEIGLAKKSHEIVRRLNEYPTLPVLSCIFIALIFIFFTDQNWYLTLSPFRKKISPTTNYAVFTDSTLIALCFITTCIKNKRVHYTAGMYRQYLLP